MLRAANSGLTPIFLLVLAAGFLPLPARAAAATLTEADLTQWLEGYKIAWETRDAEKAAALFTPTATYQDEAFAPPYLGSEANGNAHGPHADAAAEEPGHPLARGR